MPTRALTPADALGRPANIVTAIPLKTLAARFPPELRPDGKIEERFSPEKLFLSGTADVKWIAESLRLLRANGV